MTRCPPSATLSAAALALLLSACAAFKGAESPSTMRLSPPAPHASAPLSPETVSVAPVRARGFTAHVRYAYVDAAEPGVLREAQTLFWEEPPPQVVERALVAALRTRFATVAATGLSLQADRRVLVTLTRFEETGAGADARAVVAFEAAMLRGPKMLRAGQWCATAPIATAHPTDRAHAFETAIATAVTTFATTHDGGPDAAGNC